MKWLVDLYFNNPKLIPTIMFGTQVLSIIPYLYQRNWRMAVYWAAAATLTACITLDGK